VDVAGAAARGARQGRATSTTASAPAGRYFFRYELPRTARSWTCSPALDRTTLDVVDAWSDGWDGSHGRARPYRAPVTTYCAPASPTWLWSARPSRPSAAPPPAWPMPSCSSTPPTTPGRRRQRLGQLRDLAAVKAETASPEEQAAARAARPRVRPGLRHGHGGQAAARGAQPPASPGGASVPAVPTVRSTRRRATAPGRAAAEAGPLGGSPRVTGGRADRRRRDGAGEPRGPRPHRRRAARPGGPPRRPPTATTRARHAGPGTEGAGLPPADPAVGRGPVGTTAASPGGAAAPLRRRRPAPGCAPDAPRRPAGARPQPAAQPAGEGAPSSAPASTDSLDRGNPTGPRWFTTGADPIHGPRSPTQSPRATHRREAT
jgi:hypothetical protein